MPESIKIKVKGLMGLAMSNLPHSEFMDKFQELLNEARLEERRRAARIVLEFEVYSPYIVQKNNIAERKKQLVDLIMDGMDNGIQGQGKREGN